MRLTLHKKKIATLLLFLGMAFCAWLLFSSDEDELDEPLPVPTLSIEARQPSGFLLPRGSPMQMRLGAYRNNLRQPIFNANNFSGRPELVVVAQIRGGPGSGARLKLLAESLQTAGPGATGRLLLVLSMEKPCAEAANAMRTIDFCRVLPIYFAYSASFYPDEFPGSDPADCPRDLPKESAILKGCTNAEYPDSHGHYREATFTQEKHHWMWQLHFTWQTLREVVGYSGYVLFLEEGSYLLPDWLHILRLMQKQCKEEGCHLLSLGGTSIPEVSPDPQQLEVSGFVAPKHRSALAMSREVYYQLMGCLAEFCTYDDYNWDWSLQHVSATCLSHPLKVLYTRLPRVLDLPGQPDERGMCARTGPCSNIDAASQALREKVRQLSGRLFPKTVEVAARQQEVRNPPPMVNGGWGDVRDHVLCKNYARL
ncbi:PREDICTED: alpha-1,6-mannosyl-glycoprotein 2-beta-N-acetylglucosaminyltransferase-like [Nanorana parkeri]|uniref:alpha-1,6-mannosyl-glycoprotein 2-beta-N-acetylglucosaminyltransferase-like n=1 Tax=Nanorana parkeri TaxID=125878 RepID=UPI00085479F9|nr:PREDICTED: alpha-1,6-mannosyl-glycoprotein 2-beta-N-acetylglucosaminyltransferase-like [Nanorana parkeri]